MDIFKVIFLSLFVNNIALTKFLGIRQFSHYPRLSDSARKGIALLLITVISSAVISFINQHFLEEHGLSYILTFVTVIIVLLLTLLLSYIFRKIFKSDLHEIAANSIILGILLITFRDKNINDIMDIMIYTLSASAGYLLVSVIISAISEHMRLTGIPKGMRGFPIMLITLGILALAFMGLIGIFK